MKETGQDLIKKILYLIISQSNGISFCFHLTQTLTNPIKFSWKSLSLLLDTYEPRYLYYESIYLLKTFSCQNLLNWKTLVKKGSPHKIQAIPKYFINTIKNSKQFYFTRFFQKNSKDLKNMWRGIKKIISSNNLNHIFPTTITVNKETYH